MLLRKISRKCVSFGNLDRRERKIEATRSDPLVVALRRLSDRLIFPSLNFIRLRGLLRGVENVNVCCWSMYECVLFEILIVERERLERDQVLIMNVTFVVVVVVF